MFHKLLSNFFIFLSSYFLKRLMSRRFYCRGTKVTLYKFFKIELQNKYLIYQVEIEFTILTIITNKIQYFKIRQIVFRPKNLIRANYKLSKMKVLKDTFQQSFKLHSYWKKHTYTRAQTHTYLHVHINTRMRIRTCKHTHTHIDTIIYTQTYPYRHRLTKIYFN